MVLPGWGQAANGAWLKAPLFTGAYVGFLGWAVALNQEKQDAEGLRNAAATEDDRAFSESEVARLEDSRNAKYWLAGLVLLLSMADAYVGAHLRGFEDRIDAEVGLVPVDERPAVGLCLTARFDEDLGRTR
jgi:hypothetical protein